MLRKAFTQELMIRVVLYWKLQKLMSSCRSVEVEKFGVQTFRFLLRLDMDALSSFLAFLFLRVAEKLLLYVAYV